MRRALRATHVRRQRWGQAILAHKGLAGFALGNEVIKSLRTMQHEVPARRELLSYYACALLFSLATPIGIGIGWSVVSRSSAPQACPLASFMPSPARPPKSTLAITSGRRLRDHACTACCRQRRRAPRRVRWRQPSTPWARARSSSWRRAR